MIEYEVNELINLDSYKSLLKDYVNSGDYHKEISNTISQSASHVNPYIGQKNICVILDIDQTSIDQMPLMLKYDFGWFNADLQEADIRTDFPVIQETLSFYNGLLINYIDVIFLTSRRQKYDKYTKQLLANCGYKDYTQLITRPNDDEGTIQDFKIRSRQQLVAQGWNIIANIGDQQSDLDGGNPDYDGCFKLPNPFYLITSEM